MGIREKSNRHFHEDRVFIYFEETSIFYQDHLLCNTIKNAAIDVTLALWHILSLLKIKIELNCLSVIRFLYLKRVLRVHAM